MGLLDRLSALPGKLLGGPIESLAKRGPAMRMSEIPGVLFSSGAESASGQTVDADSALSLSAVFAAANFLSEIIASLPLDVYRDMSDGGRQVAKTHPARRVLALKPNAWMTSKTARKVMEWNRLMGGKACAEIQWNMGGNVANIWPLAYWRVQEKFDDNGLYYWVDNERRVEADDMLYVPLIPGDDGGGSSFLDYAVESLGLAMSAQECAAFFFGNGAHASGILNNNNNPTKEQRAEFRKLWEESHGGKNKGRVAVTWGGWEYSPDSGSVNPDNAQLLESRKFSVEETARWFNLPPFFLGDLTYSRFANAEQQSINLVVFTLTSILCGYEQEYDCKLLSPPDVFSKHSVVALLRGDHKARSEFYKLMAMLGVFSINDILKLEDQNPIGEMGDLRFVQGNMITLEQAKYNADNPGKASAPTPAPVGDNTFDSGSGGSGSGSADGGVDTPADPQADPNLTPSQDAGIVAAMLADTYRRMLRKEANAAKRAALKPSSFLSWMDEFYPHHAETIAEALAPAATGIRASLASELIAVHANRSIEQSKADLLKATETTAAKLPAAVDALLAQWDQERPALHAADFLRELNNARTAS